MPDQRISAYESPFFAVPAYYNLFPQQPPTYPGWYFCWSGSEADYLYWKDNAFWNGEAPQDGITHWVELPPRVDVTWWVELPRFVQEILSQP